MSKIVLAILAFLSFAGAGKVVFDPPASLAHGDVVFWLLIAFGVILFALFVRAMPNARR